MPIASYIGVAAVCFALSAAPAAAAEAKGTDLVIIFDTSGSMLELAGGRRKLEIAKDAMWKFIDSLPADVNLGLVAFREGCGAEALSPVVKASPAARKELKTKIAGLRAAGSTPIGKALAEARKLLASSSRKRRIVAVTDGEETCSEAELASNADAAWNEKMKVYAVGFALGQEPSLNFRKIGLYHDARDAGQLQAVFSDIQKNLEREAGKYDETRAAAAGELPPNSRAGKRGCFEESNRPYARRLYKTLKLDSSYEPRFGARDCFQILEHGYHAMLNEAEFRVDKVEVLRVRLEEKLNFAYGGVEGFVLASEAGGG